MMLAWILARKNLILGGLVLVALVAAYVKGRFDQQKSDLNSKLEKTVTDYETERKIKDRVGSSTFGDVLDLNNSMWPKYQK